MGGDEVTCAAGGSLLTWSACGQRPRRVGESRSRLTGRWASGGGCQGKSDGGATGALGTCSPCCCRPLERGMLWVLCGGREGVVGQLKTRAAALTGQ